MNKKSKRNAIQVKTCNQLNGKCAIKTKYKVRLLITSGFSISLKRAI